MSLSSDSKFRLQVQTYIHYFAFILSHQVDVTSSPYLNWKLGVRLELTMAQPVFCYLLVFISGKEVKQILV